MYYPSIILVTAVYFVHIDNNVHVSTTNCLLLV